MLNPKPDSAGPSIDYVTRINRAIDFVLRHLDQPLTLETVARAAAFSPFHFHRIFKSIMGEPLNVFIKRIRLERSLALLSQKSWRQKSKPSLTDIALACGFSSSADFSRSFKQAYGAPPSKFDLSSHRSSKRETWQDAIASPESRHLLDRLPVGENPDNFQVEIRNLPSRSVAYLRVHDSFRPHAVPQATERFIHWAKSQGLEQGQWLGYMWDDPEIVPYQKCRYDIGLVLPLDTPAIPSPFGKLTFPAMTVAEIEIRGDISLEQRALDYLFQTWLPRSAYLPTDQPCFEAWVGLPYANGFEYFELTIQLPVGRA